MVCFGDAYSQKYTMGIHQKNGTITAYDTEVIDSVTFVDRSNGVPSSWQYTGQSHENPAGAPQELDYSARDFLNGISPLKGKHLFGIGDSHLEISKQHTFLNMLAEMTGAEYHQILKRTPLDSQEIHFFVDDEDTGIVPNCDGYNWAQYVDVLADYCTRHGINMDYLFIENCHFNQWDVDNNVPTIYLGESRLYPTLFPDYDTMYWYWSRNFETILKEMDIRDSSNASVRLKCVWQSSQILRFSFTNGEVLNMDAEVSIWFGDEKSKSNKLAVSLKQGMNIEECINQINQWAFEEKTDWKNPNKGVGGYRELLLQYVGGKDNNPTAMAHIDVPKSCNLTMTSELGVSYYYADRTYKHFSSDKITDKNEWLEHFTNGWVVPNYMMGAVEYLKIYNPGTKIVMLGIPMYSSSEENAVFSEDGQLQNEGCKDESGNIIPYAILNSPQAKQGYISKRSCIEVARKYALQYIDLEVLSGITPYNMYKDGYYNYNDVHPTQKGYEKWAECISMFIR